MGKKMMRGFAVLGLCCMLLILPVFQSAAAGTGTVKNRALNVREKASTSSSIVCKLSKGDKVTIQSDTKGTDGMKWYEISCTSKGVSKKGYVRADLVTASGDTASTSSSSSTSNLADADKLYVKGTGERPRIHQWRSGGRSDQRK